MKSLFRVFFVLCFLSANAQYKFNGTVKRDSIFYNTAYLSLVENYRELSRISENQIINVSEIDSLGYFQFTGSNLPESPSFYRIHLGTKEDITPFLYDVDFGHNFVLFKAANRDSITTEKPLNTSIFGTVKSHKDKNADCIMQLDSLQHKLFESLDVYRSKKQEELFYVHYYKTLKDFCKGHQDPFLNLVAISFMKNADDTQQTHFINDFKKSPKFYLNTLKTLEKNYPEKKFTEIFRRDIEFLNLKLDGKNLNYYKTINTLLILIAGVFLAIILVLSILIFRKKQSKSFFKQGKQRLTKQEKKVFVLIKEGKTNNEIAKALFVSLSTIKTHINNIYGKLNVSSRDELKDFDL